MNRIKQAWLVLIGVEDIVALKSALAGARVTVEYTLQLYEDQKKRADLAAKLYNEAEVGRKQSSDAIGQLAIDKANLQASVDYLRDKLSQYEGTSV